MTIPKITPYTGGVANPDGSQTQTEFTQNMFDQLSYEANLSTELNNTVDGINDTAIQVDADASSASQSAAAAEAAVSGLDYQGLWPDTGGSANKGETWQTQTGGTPTGQYFTALQNTIADPVSDNVNWREVVSKQDFDDTKVDVASNERDIFRNLDECKKMLSRVHLGRGGNVWNFGRIINILSDSIGHGAYAGELYFNGWTQILRRMANIEFGSASWGFVSICDSASSGSDSFQEVHSVVRNGAWVEKFRADASYIINGFGLRSSTATDNLQITVPTFTDKFTVWWSKLPTGGSFEIYVNGALKATQPTLGGTNEGWFLSTSVAMEDNGKGSCNIEIRVVGDGDVEILGMSYFNSIEDLMVNNFSQFGRRLSEVDEQTIITAIEGATDFVLALGYNDAGPANSDPLIAAAFTQRIDWIIQYCNQFNVNAIILDFNWARPESWHVRQELERCANSINSAKFVPFPRYLSIDNQPQSPAGYLQPIGFLVDDAHPTVLGHGMIAETVSKALGLSVNSKEQANRNDTMWIPFQISSVNDLENRFPLQPRRISSWRLQGSSVAIKWYVQRTGGAAFATGSYRLVDSTDFNVPQGYFVDVRSDGVTTTNDGVILAITQRMDARQDGGEINIVIDSKNTAADSVFYTLIPVNDYRPTRV